MLAAIIGGRLQGVEVACLAGKAGWQTLLVDRRRSVPAQGLVDRFLRVDVETTVALDEVLGKVDLVIPAMENQAALNRLDRWCRERGIPLAFDSAAYAVTCSKIASNRFFDSLGIPVPDPWPGCGFPVVAKPDCASGSQGVMMLKDPVGLAAAFPGGLPATGWLLQQYLDGPSFSLEVIGRPGDYAPLQVTELFMDAAHDCRMVAAPSGLTAGEVGEIEALGVAIAEALELTGLMDVEVIRHRGRFKVLEIDARVPSQTPLAVHASTGCNMAVLLAEIHKHPQATMPRLRPTAYGAILEHIRVTPAAIFREGEHVMRDCGLLKRVPGFFGADEALTTFRPGTTNWVATLIVRGRSRRDAERRRDRVLASIRRDLDIARVVDSVPEHVA